MPKRTDFIDWAEEQLSPLGLIRVKSMFGGFGVYADDLFFAIIDDDVLYFKADDINRARFVEAGCEVFRYPMKDGSMNELSYYQAPETALDDQTDLLDWARLGLEAALRAQRTKMSRKAPKRKSAPG